MNKFLMMFVVLLFTGCTTVTQEYDAIGGSKSDGNIVLALQYVGIEPPKVNDVKGDKIAKDRCKKWGYSDAESFGRSSNNCTKRDMYGICYEGVVSKTYQCLDKK